MRINRYFTEHGVISRREADRAIELGRVFINGRRAKLGDRVMPDDEVSLDGLIHQAATKSQVILAYNKPVGIECTSNPEVSNNIIAAVGYPQRVFHIGRLDKDSEGLILLTNVGDIVNKILKSSNCHEKEYVVTLNGPITDEALQYLCNGVALSDGLTKPCRIVRENRSRIRIILTEGRNRQIRRMIESVGLKVIRLKRIRIMNVHLGLLPVGRWRKFRKDEVSALLARLA